MTKKTTKKTTEAKTTATKKAKFQLTKGQRIVATIALLAVNLGVWYGVGQVAFQLQADYGFFLTKKVERHIADTDVVAKIGDEVITLSDVKAYARDIPQLDGIPFELVYARLLDTMVTSKVLLQAAENTAIEEDETVAKALKAARDQVLSQAYLSKAIEEQMTEEALQEMYTAEIQNFERPEEVHALHILVASKKEAQDIIAQLNAGIDFATLADSKSLDTDNKGGDLGYFTKNMMIPEFGEAVFKLNKGQVSAPIKTVYGWHVVKVLDKRLAELPTFEEVQEQLKQAWAEAHVADVIKAERDNAGVQIVVPQL